MKKGIVLAFLPLFLPLFAQAEEGLKNCVEQFPGSAISGAPSTKSTPRGTPAPGNLHICKRLNKINFFALEYDPQRLTSIWVAYRLENRFGVNKCASVPRKQMQCYFSATNVSECLRLVKSKRKSVKDPFHVERVFARLGIKRLKSRPYGGTDHDRGHLAPNNAFSWHMCGAYKTFSMANMAPQHKKLNRNSWRLLEESVLYWGTTNGPIYVVTGPVFDTFPLNDFKSSPSLKKVRDKILPSGETLRNDSNRGSNPVIPKPTGFYKVIYKPPVSEDTGHAIGFLLPHTDEADLDFTHFVTSIQSIEKVSDLTFAIPEKLKSDTTQSNYWLSRRPPSNWSVRVSAHDIAERCPSGYNAKGWFARTAPKKRKEICRSSEIDLSGMD